MGLGVYSSLATEPPREPEKNDDFITSLIFKTIRRLNKCEYYICPE